MCDSKQEFTIDVSVEGEISASRKEQNISTTSPQGWAINQIWISQAILASSTNSWCT